MCCFRWAVKYLIAADDHRYPVRVVDMYWENYGGVIFAFEEPFEISVVVPLTMYSS